MIMELLERKWGNTMTVLLVAKEGNKELFIRLKSGNKRVLLGGSLGCRKSYEKGGVWAIFW